VVRPTFATQNFFYGIISQCNKESNKNKFTPAYNSIKDIVCCRFLLNNIYLYGGISVLQSCGRNNFLFVEEREIQKLRTDIVH